MPLAAAPGSWKFWVRLVLVGLCGAAPLFVVSLFLIQRVYGAAIDFAVRERRGVQAHARLERALQAAGSYSAAAARRSFSRAPSAPTLEEAARSLDAAVRELAVDGAELGSQLTRLQRATANLQGDIPATALAKHGANAVDALIEMIERNGDSSNLVLDDQLDSYYLMRAVLVGLPQAERRIATI